MRIPDRPCGVALRENWGHMRVARLSEKIPYGVYRSENRARTAVHGPSNPTFIIPQLAAFVKYYFKKKFEEFSFLEFNTQVGRQFIIKFHVLTAITASHIMGGFYSHVGAVRTTLFRLFPINKTRPISNHSAVSRTGKPYNHSQSSSSQGALPKPSKWQRGYSSPSSCQ